MSKTQKSLQTFPTAFSHTILDDLLQAVKQGQGPRSAYLLEHLLSKFADPSPALARMRADAAVAKWLIVEEKNYRTNQRLMLHDNGDNPLSRITGATADELIDKAANLIRKLIGNRPPNLLYSGGFSGGASTSKRRQAGMLERKYVGKQHVTTEAWYHMWRVLEHAPLWCDLSPDAMLPYITDHSVMFTVPKNDTIDRVACKEPDYNMYLQKGVGDFFRTRLRKRAGIDLNDQGINQELARKAYHDGLATIDLSSASDSVTTQLVCRLLPVSWFVYLQEIRVPTVLVPGVGKHSMEMFSTMGNGFTFELESLIFYALTRVAVDCDYPEGIVSVYGDDIIAPSRSYGLVRTLLNYCGFTVNLQKSFAAGPIRESCGRHFHCGTEVTPFYVKRPIRTILDLILLLNKVRNWSSRYGDSAWCESLLEPFWQKYASYVPKKLRGGHDVFASNTLASPRGAGFRLVQKKPRKSGGFLEFGSYIHWMHVAEKRSSLTESRSAITVEKDDWAFRPPLFRASDFGLRIPLFPHEVGGGYSSRS